MRKGICISILLMCLASFALSCGTDSKSNDDSDIDTSSVETISSEDSESVATAASTEIKGTLQDDTDADGIYYSEPPTDIEEIKSNIKVEVETHERDMAVILTNENAFVIPYLKVEVVFYNNGNMLDSEKDGHDVLLPYKTVASKISVPENADEYDISLEVEWDSATSYRNWSDNVSYESNVGNNNVMIQFTNNGDVDIEELEYIVLYYMDNEFVGISYDQDITDFLAGTSIVEECSSYGIDFDDYKIYINQAHTFGR